MPGLAALVALIFSFQAVKATDTQLHIAEQGQITDRYNTAITNLGSRSIDIRLGGVYALQRLMQDSSLDQPAVVAVLCAFVRDQTASTATTQGSQTSRTPTDIQATLTVVGTRNTANDGHTTVVDFNRTQLANARLFRAQFSGADFSDANLAGANLDDANLAGASLSDADLNAATFVRADLTRADLTGADFRGAILLHADLARANLSSADLRRTALFGADLTGAELFGADLRGADLRADLTGADLTAADLRGVDLRGAQVADAGLAGADLRGAIWPKNVPAPTGWVREPSSGRLSRAK